MTTKTIIEMLKEKFEKADFVDIAFLIMCMPIAIVGTFLLCGIIVMMVVSIIYEILKN